METFGTPSAFDPQSLSMGATQMGSAAEISTFIAADKVQGAAIYNTTGDKLGLIDDIVINKKTGDIAYAIISSGGFL